MYSTLAVINLDRIRSNAALFSAAVRRPLIAVVKDDAYGHGAEAVAHALQPQVSAFAVATSSEGASLRVAGISSDILVLAPPLFPEEAFRMRAYGLTAALSSLRSLRLYGGEGGKAHIAVNTGMNRYGVRPERAGYLAKCARDAGVEVTGVFSHLYAPADKNAVEAQRARYEEGAARVREIFPNAVRHLGATGGGLAGECFDAVRAGIALYGYLPEGFSLPVKPAMRVYAYVAEERAVLGGGLGYNAAPENASRAYTLRFGYGDGFFRAGGLGEGTLCMDACLRLGRARAGERRLIFCDAERYARAHGTTAYETLVSVGKSAVREYRGG